MNTFIKILLPGVDRNKPIMPILAKNFFEIRQFAHVISISIGSAKTKNWRSESL